MTPKQIIETMNAHYIAESGLGRIDRDDSMILSDGTESCRNENGVLFLAYMIARGVDAGVQLTQEAYRALRAAKSLQVLPGLFQRQPDGSYPYEQHDNYVGTTALCVMRGDSLTPAQMISHAWRNFFCFNDKNPGTFKWSQVRQPGEIALYYLAANRKPPMLFWLWFLVGMFINGYKKTPDAPQARLTWLRKFIVGYKLNCLGGFQFLMYVKVLAYWKRRTVQKHGSLDAIWSFPEGHPICLFNELKRITSGSE